MIFMRASRLHDDVICLVVACYLIIQSIQVNIGPSSEKNIKRETNWMRHGVVHAIAPSLPRVKEEKRETKR